MKRQHIDNDKVIKVFKQQLGYKNKIAEALGIHTRTLHRWIDSSKELQQAHV